MYLYSLQIKGDSNKEKFEVSCIQKYGYPDTLSITSNCEIQPSSRNHLTYEISDFCISLQTTYQIRSRSPGDATKRRWMAGIRSTDK
jgi:hypothetical protein